MKIDPRPWTIWSFLSNNNTRETVGITMLADYLEGEVKLSEEHTEYKWIFPAEFAELNADPSLKAEIAKLAEQ